MSIIHIPFYPSDWLAGTRGLSDVETGVYITLVARMYEMAGPIERNDDRLFRLCGSKSKASFVKALDYLMSEGKIISTPEGLINEKVAKVIKETTEKSAKAKAAAQSRWDRKGNKNNGDTNANASPEHMPEKCQLKPKPYNEDTNVSSNGDFAKSHGFSEFWELWPDKKGKEPARKAWRKLKIEDKRLAFSAARDGWFYRWQQSKPDANPIHASSFLNNKRWTDEFQPQFKTIDGGRNGEPASSQHFSAPQGQRRSDPAIEDALRLTGLSGASRHAVD